MGVKHLKEELEMGPSNKPLKGEGLCHFSLKDVPHPSKSPKYQRATTTWEQGRSKKRTADQCLQGPLLPSQGTILSNARANGSIGNVQGKESTQALSQGLLKKATYSTSVSHSLTYGTWNEAYSPDKTKHTPPGC